jgi:hypothetical protein
MDTEVLQCEADLRNAFWNAWLLDFHKLFLHGDKVPVNTEPLWKVVCAWAVSLVNENVQSDSRIRLQGEKF